jgi:hypothetical protein
MAAESIPWLTSITGSGCTANAGHSAFMCFDFLVTGFGGLSVNQPMTLTSPVLFSAEL